MYLRGKIARIKCVQISERKAPGRTDGRPYTRKLCGYRVESRHASVQRVTVK